MLNKYPAWKNALILLVVLLGFLYSVPNIYPDDEAIQISADSLTLSESDMVAITSALEAAQVEFFGEEITEESILIRLNSVEDQLVAKTAIEGALTDDYIVALNLAPTTPLMVASDWRRENELRS
jgi:preprotein translocase subunit SecD